MIFSFLRVPVQSFEKGPLFRPRVALFWSEMAKNLEKAYLYIKNQILLSIALKSGIQVKFMVQFSLLTFPEEKLCQRLLFWPRIAFFWAKDRKCSKTVFSAHGKGNNGLIYYKNNTLNDSGNHF